MSDLRLKGPYTVESGALYAQTSNGRILLAEFSLPNGLDPSEQGKIAMLFAGLMTAVERRERASQLPESAARILSAAEDQVVSGVLQGASRAYLAVMPGGLWSFTT